jgi:flagellar M-ring protein FliF
LRRLSIAVQVDGLKKPQADGSIGYEPRSAEELAELAALVRSAAGVDESRGDVVEVVSRAFADLAPAAGPEPEPAWLDGILAGQDRLIELGVLSLLTLAVLFFGVRPAVRRLLAAAAPPQGPAPGATAVVLGPDGRPLLVHGATGATIGIDRAGNPVVVREPVPVEALPQPGHATPEEIGGGEMVDLKQVRGLVHASLLGQVARAIEANPEDAVRVVRGWLHGS